MATNRVRSPTARTRNALCVTREHNLRRSQAEIRIEKPSVSVRRAVSSGLLRVKPRRRLYGGANALGSADYGRSPTG
jgi:hypothetical protein